MKTNNFSSELAVEMNKVLNSEEHSSLFRTSSMLEKLAFASSDCECSDDCKCKCDKCKDCKKDANDANDSDLEVTAEVDADELLSNLGVEPSVSNAVNAILAASEALEELGLVKSASYSLGLANAILVEAKSKKDPAKEKEKAAKEKAKLKAQKEKDKEKAAKEKAKAEKDKNDARDKAVKDKAAKEKADKAAKEKAAKDKAAKEKAKKK